MLHLVLCDVFVVSCCWAVRWDHFQVDCGQEYNWEDRNVIEQTFGMDHTLLA